MSYDDLIQKIVIGDESYFGKFIELHSTHLFYYSLGIVKQKESAEEIVSDVFFEVWKKRENLQEIGNIKNWLLVITYRKSISFLRKESDNNKLISFEELDYFQITSFQTPDNEIISQQEIDNINSVIEQLPPKCKHVFYLAKIEKLPYLEIAEMLNISVKTINNHIAHALESISEKMNIPMKK